MIAIVAIQRAVQKILIAVFLTREFKHDETNRAWWTGQWYGRGLGNSAISQPAREFVVKIVEMSLWSSDFLLAHILLVILTVPLFIPWFDRIHSTMLCKSSSSADPPSLTVVSAVWLRPSKQIRAPLFSTKQKRQRRWIVVKYSVIYLTVVAGLVALIALRKFLRHILASRGRSYCLQPRSSGIV